VQQTAALPNNAMILRDMMLEAPPWAGGLPLAGEHKIMRRYGVAASYMAIANTP